MHGMPLPSKPIKQEQQLTRPPGERRWVKPVDSANVKDLWLPKSTSTTITWEPMPNLQCLIFNGNFQVMKSRKKSKNFMFYMYFN